MEEVSKLPWTVLLSKIRKKEVNKELNTRTKRVFDALCDLTSVCISSHSLTTQIKALQNEWLPAKDQYKRSVLHLASLQGNTRLV